MVLAGTEAKYGGSILSQLREPMLTLLEKGHSIEEMDEQEDEEQAEALTAAAKGKAAQSP